MRIKKVCLFLGIVPLLVSCNQDPYLGEYVFQMGKSKETHMSVSLKLTKDIYNEETPEIGNKFALDMEMLTSDVKSDMADILNGITPINGYYRINKEEKVYGERRLNVGLSLLGEIELPEEITECLFVASINSKLVNFYIPVSVEDLEYQLYWYGYDFSIAKFLDEDETDPLSSAEGKHPIGTHPTKEDIETINKHYADEHSGKVYRDFHVLKLGLTKQ